MLLPEQTVILCDSADEARRIGTDWLRAYLALPNYANNRVGDEGAVMRRVAEHHAAGADHVCVQVLTADPMEFPREQWRRIAAAGN